MAEEEQRASSLGVGERVEGGRVTAADRGEDLAEELAVGRNVVQTAHHFGADRVIVAAEAETRYLGALGWRDERLRVEQVRLGRQRHCFRFREERGVDHHRRATHVARPGTAGTDDAVVVDPDRDWLRVPESVRPRVTARTRVVAVQLRYGVNQSSRPMFATLRFRRRPNGSGRVDSIRLVNPICCKRCASRRSSERPRALPYAWEASTTPNASTTGTATIKRPFRSAATNLTSPSQSSRTPARLRLFVNRGRRSAATWLWGRPRRSHRGRSTHARGDNPLDEVDDDRIVRDPSHAVTAASLPSHSIATFAASAVANTFSTVTFRSVKRSWKAVNSRSDLVGRDAAGGRGQLAVRQPIRSREREVVQLPRTSLSCDQVKSRTRKSSA